jgi:hypothetical protein
MKTKSFGRSKVQEENAVLIGFFAATLTEVSGQREIEAFDGLETGSTPNSVTFRSTIFRARNSGSSVHLKRFSMEFRSFPANRRGRS